MKVVMWYGEINIRRIRKNKKEIQCW
jgi:hypothetical protein